MDDTQLAMLLYSQTTCAIVEALGAFSENLQCLNLGQSMAYNSIAFDEIIAKYGIGFNSAVSILQGR